MHTEIMQEILSYLTEESVCYHIEYTGSSYEGTKVHKSLTDDDLEFDVMLIMNGGEHLFSEEISNNRGYAFLKVKPGKANEAILKNRTSRPKRPLLSFYDADQLLLDPNKVRNRFSGELQKCINNLKDKFYKELRVELILRGHGPAIQLDVNWVTSGKKFYSIDLVPTYIVDYVESDMRNYYVVKPLRRTGGMKKYEWRKSTSLDEKEMLATADGPDNGCRKKVLRILKVLKWHPNPSLGRLRVIPPIDCHIQSNVMSKQFKASRLELW